MATVPLRAVKSNNFFTVSPACLKKSVGRFDLTLVPSQLAKWHLPHHAPPEQKFKFFQGCLLALTSLSEGWQADFDEPKAFVGIIKLSTNLVKKLTIVPVKASKNYLNEREL